MSPILLAVLLVAAQRLVELAIARRNSARLLAQGGVEHGAGHYPLIVLLHAAWLASLLVVVPADRWPSPWLLGPYLFLQPLRVWVISSLGGRWTTRVIVLPGVPPVRSGPYRWVRHPNYWIVAAEIALLPLAFGAWQLALVFSLLNAAMIGWRMRVEDALLCGPKVIGRLR